jgi:hypothetical protein
LSFTGLVHADFTDLIPELFEAMTTTRSRWPTSVELMM